MLYTKFSNVDIIRNVNKFYIHTYKVTALNKATSHSFTCLPSNS
jgi:hypothetical protein